MKLKVADILRELKKRDIHFEHQSMKYFNAATEYRNLIKAISIEFWKTYNKLKPVINDRNVQKGFNVLDKKFSSMLNSFEDFIKLLAKIGMSKN